MTDEEKTFEQLTSEERLALLEEYREVKMEYEEVWSRLYKIKKRIGI